MPYDIHGTTVDDGRAVAYTSGLSVEFGHELVAQGATTLEAVRMLRRAVLHPKRFHRAPLHNRYIDAHLKLLAPRKREARRVGGPFRVYEVTPVARACCLF